MRETGANRLTIVFDDPEVYRRLKVLAAERGVPMKRLVEQALLGLFAELEGGRETAPVALARPKLVDWERWDAFQAELDALPAEDAPANLSDIKHHLYGMPVRELTRHGWMVAEEAAEYDAEYKARHGEQ